MSKKVLKLSAPEGARRKFLWDHHFCLRADGGSSAARARTEPGIKGRKGPGKLCPAGICAGRKPAPFGPVGSEWGGDFAAPSGSKCWGITC